ncbi:MAG: hypothetical protein WCF93_01945 [Candidatus Moraniibacteriota bacterium]
MNSDESPIIARKIEQNQNILPIKKILLPISGEALLLDEVNGSEDGLGCTFGFSVFKYVDPKLKKLIAREKWLARRKTAVMVFEVIRQCFWAEIPVALGLDDDLNRLCLVPPQVENFMEKYYIWLQSGEAGNSFLLKLEGKPVVIDVCAAYKGVFKCTSCYVDCPKIWNGTVGQRIVLPQIA